MKHSVQEEFRGVLIFVATLWCVLLLDWLLPIKLTDWGLTPRRLSGLPGILFAPFLHANLGHLIGNTIPLVVLLTLLAGSRTRTWETVAEIAILGGGALWLVGRNGQDNQPITHVGASGIVFGLMAFLIVAGFREKRIVSMLVALLVAFLYGGTLIAGVMPQGEGISWDGHLLSALAGAGLAYFTLGKPVSETDSSPTTTQPQ